ncbi:hypothetical protein [Nostoc sp. TCL26-01]|uniref:hypothetical protein n=1 Tax=Nostoc sp. TCL26-01 TaxID=2576904 RepID=UPI0015BE3EA7|nr:hypothetical protein [Nostoc sp. TCL26-01]QLE56676.1 hypothetical protein FD725_14890 [Nostoc sp. TCL26-01]
MTTHKLPNNLINQASAKFNTEELNLPALQESLYGFLLQLVNIYIPEDALQEFKQLFINCLESGSLNNVPIIHKIVLCDDEQEFHYTLKRSCYILINNWAAKRQYKYIQDLINLFTQLPVVRTKRIGHELATYQIWLENFVHSPDYQELKIFNYKYDGKSKTHWSDRYAHYLLVSQSLDTNKPKEQQEAASKLSRQMKDKYKFELAMYIARSQSATSSPTRYNNPSIFGDEVLRLIKMIVVKKGKFSYENLANIFLKQTQNQTLKEFKTNIQKYLFFSVYPGFLKDLEKPYVHLSKSSDQKNQVSNQYIVENLQQLLTIKLSSWKAEKNAEIINKDLLLRICNKLIDSLTLENRQEPSEIFILLLSHGHPLTLVIILLKIICICNSSRSHLESRLADLISYYKDKPEDECQWVIHFIEFYNITFAIYAENVEYNLLQVVEVESASHTPANLDTYRVFSQVKAEQAKPD